MTTALREIERKYETPANGGLPYLDGLPGVATASEPEKQTLAAVYYDTDDLRLARAGITLRRRTGGDDAGWHLKLPAGAQARDELQLPPGRSTRKVPEELAGLVRARTRGMALHPVARIRTTRTLRRLLDDGGSPLAEIVADDVAGQTLGDVTSAMYWHEIEVELTGTGDEALLEAVDARLREAGAQPAPTAAKLMRVLGGRVSETGARRPEVQLSAESSAADVVLAYVAEQIETIQSYDPKVRRDEYDSVHKMRVATRRLRSAMQAFGKVIDRERTRRLTDELKWIAGVLGEARDREVLRERLETRLAALPAELVLGPVQARIVGHFASEQAEAATALLAVLNGQRYFTLLDDLEALLADPPLTPLAARPAREVLPRLVRRTYRRLERAASVIENAAEGHERDEAIHEARKAAKRARYAGELVSPVFGKKAKRFAKRMEKLQELLGDHQDSVVTRPVVRELGVRAHLAGENAFTYGLLHEQDACLARDIERRLPKAWRRASKAKYRRWMR